MSSRYEEVTAEEAADLLVGIIGLLVAAAMQEARTMTKKEWNERDPAQLPHYFASAIFYAVQNRLGSMS